LICSARLLSILGLFIPIALPSAALAEDHAAVLEIGGAAEWDAETWQSQFGPSLAVEVTPIERWLELGVNAFRVSGKKE
jgi:hypothetical protein